MLKSPNVSYKSSTPSLSLVFTAGDTFKSPNKADDGEQAMIRRSSSNVAEEDSVNPSQQGDTELRYSNAARPQASDAQAQEDMFLPQVYEAKEQDDGAFGASESKRRA
jgi:hypothetical protein